MKSSIILILFALFSGVSQAHEYFFAFAEMEYNVKSQSYELSLVVSTHDIEHYFENQGVEVGELEDYTSDKVMLEVFSTLLLDGFAVKNQQATIDFQLIGYEVDLNGLTSFFFNAKPSENFAEFEVKFDLLMSVYPKQQNKLTFLENGQTQTAIFFPNQANQQIKLENFKHE
jgi:hypothetical protein